MPMTLEITSTVRKSLKDFVRYMPDVIIRHGGELVGIVTRRSVNEFMRDARGERRRRLPTDAGPLRIWSGRLATSLLDARPGTENPLSVYRVARESNQVTITFGSSHPGAAINEYGGTAGRGHVAYIPGRPYLGPALLETQGEVVNALDARLQQFIDEVS